MFLGSADHINVGGCRSTRNCSLITRFCGLFSELRDGPPGMGVSGPPVGPCAVRAGTPPAVRPASGRSAQVHGASGRRDDQFFVLQTAKRIVVKLAVKDADGGWQLVSDHAEWKPVGFPEDAVILG